MEIPDSPEELSSRWLTGALRGARILRGGIVAGFEPVPISGERGFYGRIVRLNLTYDPPDSVGPPTLIAKFSSPDAEMRRRPNTIASYEREVRFYRSIARRGTIPVPTCYHAAVDTRSGRHILLLEDLALARCGSRADGCSAADAETAIRHIAHFHAHWWESPELDDFDPPADSAGSPDDRILAEAHAEWWPVFLEKAGHQLPGEVVEIGGLLGRRRGSILRRLFGQRPRTLIHSDYHADNLLFGQAPGSLFVVDWQFVKLGRGMWDVAYFLSQSLAPEDRRAVETALLEEYIGVMDGLGVRGYSRDEAHYDYKLSLLHRLGALISTITAMPFSPEQLRFHVEILLPRTVAALVDHGCLSVLEEMNGVR